MIDKKSVWIFLPAYNEATVIASVLRRIKKCGYHNIVVIDDGSNDSTYQCALDENVYALKLCINRGVGAAIQLAIMYAKSKGINYLAIIDADGQHYPEDIDKLMIKMERSKADLVIGSRFLDANEGIPISRKIFNKIANWLTILGSTAVSDSQSGFRLLNRNAIEKMELKIDSYGVCTEMIWNSHKQNLKLEEVPIRVIYNDYSRSKGQNLWVGIKTSITLFKRLLS